ncbi:peptide ABC transporter ATP-binding protein [Micromonospora globispora]|uniref:ABC transporter ATP-binding protein n=1 Tax=Micromonospora globispora TaxID=1450148 RepID=UPI000D6F3BC0|nr:oligopeptide/dipeptide ABC transporter ATP-binding protein [Micromonospora globispora]PWU55414.1 peptide ABC transporter ATP-binding protein [Micromonospora globispora]RQW91813.1 peptide ABC transporter ATP-binding protein [Micromonospora globispora]
MPEEPMLRVENLVKHYSINNGMRGRRHGAVLRALDGVSFQVAAGETLGLVGESGCGKSTLAQTLLRLVEPTSGHVYYRGKDVYSMSRKELKDFRKHAQVVFQDPFESLNPRKTIGQIIAEPWTIHRGLVPRAQWRSRAAELLELVGLRRDHIDRHPGQFSGGQRQRIGIARAVAVEPDLLICDEPVSALDVSVQAQILNVIQDIQREFGLGVIFISHDLGVVRHISDKIGVMYLGRMMEYGSESDVFERPRHPYTQALISAVPVSRSERETALPRRILAGDLPSPVNPPSGCRFRTRCWQAEAICAEREPALETHHADERTRVACHFPASSIALSTDLIPGP